MPPAKDRSYPPKAVFFDIGNVLLSYDPFSAAKDIARRLGCDAGRVDPFLEASALTRRIEKGHMLPRDIYRLFCKRLGFLGGFEEFKRLWSGYFKLNAGSARILREVSRARATYLLSNTNTLHYDFIRETYAFVRHVHGAVLSYELGCRKPEPRIYREALRIARVENPEDCVFIDDRPENVEAALRLGFKAIRFRGAKALEKELKRLGALD